jgi:hypothetical protein
MFDTSCLYYASKEEILIRDIISIEEETEWISIIGVLI